MENLSGRTVKGYELRERIGAGGFGAVYKAHQSTVGREVAMKIILPHFASHPDFIRRFEAEAQLVARLEHPYITPLYDYWRDTNGAYLVMRWLKGGSLRDALQQRPFELPAALLLIEQITAALTAAHRNQVIHRDLKPGNILLDEDGNAYLGDFGIAKDVGGANGITEVDAIVGSPDYLAPEQARSEPVTPQTDIYSLGVVLYEVLTGQHPFPHLSPVERLFKHLNDPLPEITSLPKDAADAINEVIQKATSKNPAQRYADALEMAAAFRSAVRRQSGNTSNLVEQLTRREQEILQRIMDGLSNKEIAQELFLTLATVKWYVNQIYIKLGVRSRVQAIVRARELNLIVGDSVDVISAVIPTEDFKPENPYKGLRAFTAADHKDYFGREKITDKLVKRLGETTDLARFLAVVGPSGGGKSSLVKAGLIPAIWKGALPNSEKWFVVEMLPGARPLDELEIALTKVAANHTGNIHEHLERDEFGLNRVANLLLPNDGSDLLLVIDQFEEVFTLVEDEKARQHFLNLLHHAVTQPRSRVRVVVTLRADFYDRPLHYPQFGELVRSRMETVLPLSADELERAIAKPAEQVGVKFEPGLVSSIVSEVNYQPGALPLLQYALTELFERRDKRTLTREAYQAIGGTVGALAKRADEIYLSLDEAGQEAARQMFLRLVTLGEGTEDTRRRVARSELLAIAVGAQRDAPSSDAADLMDDVIDTYAEYRLLSLDNDPGTRTPTVEVAHEAILREWERLRAWLNESREEVRLQRQVMALAAEWHGAKQDASFLLRGARLEVFEKWIQETQLALTEKERAYVEASLTQRTKEESDEKTRQARELKLAKDTITAQKRAANRLRLLVAVLVVAVLGALGLSGIAINQSNLTQQALATSDANFRRAEGQRLMGLSLLEAQYDDPMLAALLAIRSLDASYSPEADAALFRALSQNTVRFILQGHVAGVQSAAYSPDGRFIISTSLSSRPIISDAATGEQLRTLQGHTNTVYTAAYSPDGQFIVTASVDRTAIIWNAATGEPIHVLEGHTNQLHSAVFSPDGRFVATASGDQNVIIWNAATGEQLRVLRGHLRGISDLAYSPDGQFIVTAGWDGDAIIWNADTGEQVRVLQGNTEGLFDAAYSPDGRFIATARVNERVTIWDAVTGEQVQVLSGHFGVVYSVAYSPDGRYIVTGSEDGTAIVWNTATGGIARILRGHLDVVTDAAFSPDGRSIVTTSEDNTAIVWSITPEEQGRVLSGHRDFVLDAAYSPDGQFIVTASPDRTAIIWNAATGEQVRTLEGHRQYVVGAEYSPDGRFIVTASWDTTAMIWDAATGEPVHVLDGHIGVVEDAAFSPDGRLVVTVSNDNNIIVWDAATGEQVRTWRGHSAWINAVMFSPDGRFIATASEDMRAIIWDVNTGEQIRVLAGHTRNLIDVAYSPDGRFIVTAGWDRIPIIWDAATGEQIRTLQGHTEEVNSAAYSPDGRFIVTATANGRLIIWDASTGEPIRTLQGHTSFANSAAYSPDGRYIVSASGDQTAIIWIARVDDFVAYVCDRLIRDFTEDERGRYNITDTAPTCPQFAAQATPTS